MNERPPAKGFAPDGARLGAKGEAAGKIGVLLHLIERELKGWT